MSKKRKKTNLLANQKPKRRWSLAPRAIRRILLTLVILVIGGISLYRSYRWIRASGPGLGERPALQAIRGLSDTEQRSILEAYRKISAPSPDQLQTFSQDLYKNLGLRSVQLVQTAPDRIAVATEPFLPELLVELDRLRYVSSDGIVFGQLPEKEATAELTVLRGLYKNLAGLRTENGTYLIGEANQRIVEDALLAIQAAKKYNIKYRSLTYDEFRGLSGDLLQPNYRITLGFRPFEDKYLKLQKIIDSLKERGLQSATIELDYKGKAFIKETVF
jgi:hypothetical protein